MKVLFAFIAAVAIEIGAVSYSALLASPAFADRCDGNCWYGY